MSAPRQMARLLAAMLGAVGLASGCSTCAPPLAPIGPSLAGCSGDVDVDAVRVATYNIKFASVASIDAIAETLRAIDADIIALQEVDKATPRADCERQASSLAAALDMSDVVFAKARGEGAGDDRCDDDGCAFGVALLSRFPIVDHRRTVLEGPLQFEPRVLLEARVCVGGGLRVVVTHLDVVFSARDAQAELAAAQLRTESMTRSIVMGDLNTGPQGVALRSFLSTGLSDVGAGSDVVTHPGLLADRIDYILITDDLRAEDDYEVVDADTSDHFPVAVTIRLR